MSRRRAWRGGVALLAVVLAATAAWSGWRYHLLGAEIDAGRESLWGQIAVPAGDTVDASVHVARTLDANASAFDHLIVLSTARRLALIIGVGCACGAFSALIVMQATRSPSESS